MSHTKVLFEITKIGKFTETECILEVARAWEKVCNC